MEDVKSILVASERLFGCDSDPAEMMRQTRVVAEVSLWDDSCVVFESHCTVYEMVPVLPLSWTSYFLWDSSNTLCCYVHCNCLAFLLHFYPRDAMLARVIAITTCPSVRLSVRLSVTRRYCVKTKKASGMISSPSGSPKTLVFWRQRSVGKIQRFFSFTRQYLEKGSRYGRSYY